MDKQEKTIEQTFARYIKFGVIAIIVIFLLFLGVYKVNAGYRGVVLTFGKPSESIAQEGLNFKIPIVQTVKKYEVRTQKIETVADSASKDLQDVQTTIALNFHLDPGAVNKLHQEVGRDYKVRIIDPAIQEAVKAATAQFRAEDLIQRRPEARKKMRELLETKLEKYHIVVNDLNIINFQFSEKFDEAIEEKMVAEQLKLKADRDLERIKIEKEQTITQAEAEAEALRLQKQQITPDLIKLRQIEVQKLSVEVRLEAIKKWNGILPMITGSGGIPLIEMSQLQASYLGTEISEE